MELQIFFARDTKRNERAARPAKVQCPYFQQAHYDAFIMMPFALMMMIILLKKSSQYSLSVISLQTSLSMKGCDLQPVVNTCPFNCTKFQQQCQWSVQHSYMSVSMEIILSDENMMVLTQINSHMCVGLEIGRGISSIQQWNYQHNRTENTLKIT